ncbi:MAG: peptidylprolyl isomerase [Planctomycetota bacterium]
MNLHQLYAIRTAALCTLLGFGLLPQASATIVRYDTSLGTIDVRLYDSATPQSVANFLSYVDTDRWDGTFIHRSVPGFIVQGGGFSLSPDIFSTTSVNTDPPVLNEPVLTNVRGTVAYAKLGGDPNSATSQWFFNLADNAANLDNQNGGFTVFGRIVGSGLSVVDSIAALPRVNAGGAFTDVPVTDIDQVVSQQNIFASEAVLINDVFVVDIPDGDYNFDGTVDTSDLAVLDATFGSTTNVAADGNGNGIVDGADFLVWQKTLGETTAAIGTVVTNIPEPSSLLIGSLGLLAFFAGRR